MTVLLLGVCASSRLLTLPRDGYDSLIAPLRPLSGRPVTDVTFSWWHPAEEFLEVAALAVGPKDA